MMETSDELVEIEFDLSLARGLNYYTGIIYEVVAPESNIGSLGGGGANVQISSKMVKLGGGDLGLAIDAYTYPANTGQGRTKFESLVGRG